MTHPVYQLKIRRLGSSNSDVCDFELSWGKGQILSAEITYPLSILLFYKDWKNAYLQYYCKLRGRNIDGGVIDIVQSGVEAWRSRLIETEVALLQQFQSWLRHPALEEIRAELIHATQTLKTDSDWVDLFLNCFPPELEHLPWESWEICSPLATNNPIRIARQPTNIRFAPVKPIRRKARVLVIYGYAKDLNLTKDAAAIKILENITQITSVRWHPDQDAVEIKQVVSNAIANPQGWDMLVFVGHSVKTDLTSGQLWLNSQVSIHVSELAVPLGEACRYGLQFALFNSCDGISTAKFLIELGLSQVIVMREPIHDAVAHIFLQQFLTSMASYQDVHTALLKACSYMVSQAQKLAYPSAFLVPSIFRHPGATVFRIEPFSWQHRLKQFLPLRKERLWLITLLLFSLIPHAHDLLLENRLLSPAANRQWNERECLLRK